MLITNYTIALDKLELQLSYPDPLLTAASMVDGFTRKTLNLATVDTLNAQDSYTANTVALYRTAKPVGHYKLQYDVVINGTDFGFIRLLPTNPSKFFGGQPLVNISIANKVLYSSELLHLLNTFLDTFQLTINNITRYDIALDSNTDSNAMLLNYFLDNDLHFMSRGRKTSQILKVATMYRNGKENASFYVGERGSIQVAFYCKSAQTGKKVYTDYQKAYHHANGLDTDQPIYRQEVRVPRKALIHYAPTYVHHATNAELSVSKYAKLSATEQLSYTKKTAVTARMVTVAELVNTDKLLELFKLDYTSIIDFRHMDKANKDRCTKVQIIDFESVNEYIVKPIIKDSMHMDTNITKKQIKNNLENYKYSKKALYWDEAKTLADLHNMTAYFGEQQAKLRVSAPVLVSLPYDYSSPTRPSIISLF